MGLSGGAKVKLLEGVVRSVSKEVYGKGPKHVRCVRQGNVFLITCRDIFSTVERGLVEQGTEGILTLQRIRRELFEKERALIEEQLRASDIRVQTVLQELHHDKGERLLVVVTEEQTADCK